MALLGDFGVEDATIGMTVFGRQLSIAHNGKRGRSLGSHPVLTIWNQRDVTFYHRNIFRHF